MGEVYLAHDTRLDRRVALKILPPDVADNRQRMQRFVQEAKATSALNHPNILTIYEIGTDGPTNFIASEFVVGETLRQLIKKDKPLQLSLVLDLAIQTAAALSAAHASNIVHRDIKPENIMRRSDGIVKVLDFGLAKHATDISASLDTQSPTMPQFFTEPGTVVGTAAYMSPEQARGMKLDQRTDIFSLGIVIYEMVTGHLPSGETSPAESLAQLLSDKQPPPLARYAHEIPDELERIVTKALRKQRDDRYQTARDLQLDLQSLKADLEFKNRLDVQTSGSGTSADNESRVSSHTRSNTLTKVVLTLLALLIVGLLAARYYYRAHARGETIDSIAVLPLINNSGDPNLEYLTEGLAESLMNSLSQLPNLKVVSRTSTLRYKGKGLNAQQVGKELNVRSVLTGSLKEYGERIVVSVSLDDANDDHQIWGEQYDRKVSDLLSVQQDIAREITSKLRLKLSSTDETRLARRYTENTDAYKLYLEGRYFLNKRTGESVNKAVGLFQEALTKDPNYALAYSGLADAYFLLNVFSESTPAESYQKSKSAALQAIALDEDLAEPHASLGSVLCFYDRNFPEAEREFRRAIDLNPNYATAHHWYAINYLAKVGRFDEAFAEFNQALRLDPFSLIINADLGNAYIHAHQYQKAIEQLKKTLEMDQSFYFAHMPLGIAYQMTGAFDEATREYEKARQINDDPWIVALLAQVAARSGKRDVALKYLEELNKVAAKRYVSAYGFAIVYDGLGNKDRALQELQKSADAREPRIIRIKVDPLLDDLHSDKRFGELVRRLGL